MSGWRIGDGLPTRGVRHVTDVRVGASVYQRAEWLPEGAEPPRPSQPAGRMPDGGLRTLMHTLDPGDPHDPKAEREAIDREEDR